MQTIPNSNEPFLTYLAPGSVDKTRYLFFGDSANPDNSGAQWQDESGNDNHLVNVDPDDRFAVATAAGRQVLRSSDATGGQFDIPFAVTTPSDYFIIAAVRPDSLQNPYLLDAGGHSLGIGFNNSELGAYYLGLMARGANALSVAGNELALLEYDLTASNGGIVRKNGEQVYAGDYDRVPFAASGAFGHDNSVYYMPFNGDAHFLLFAATTADPLTDIEKAQARAYVANAVGIAL